MIITQQALKSIKNRWSKIDGVVIEWLGLFLIKIYRLKHVECFRRINNLKDRCIFLVLLKEYITTHGLMNVKRERIDCSCEWLRRISGDRQGN